MSATARWLAGLPGVLEHAPKLLGRRRLRRVLVLGALEDRDARRLDAVGVRAQFAQATRPAAERLDAAANLLRLRAQCPRKRADLLRRARSHQVHGPRKHGRVRLRVRGAEHADERLADHVVQREPRLPERVGAEESTEGEAGAIPLTRLLI